MNLNPRAKIVSIECPGDFRNKSMTSSQNTSFRRMEFSPNSIDELNQIDGDGGFSVWNLD